ncbi:hypothetical protein NIES22_17060 [Calothrix brevissima NIES-22]|nr:hypothetical protein NIES22_17060 [Calothrix brevissima NIES-22]
MTILRWLFWRYKLNDWGINQFAKSENLNLWNRQDAKDAERRSYLIVRVIALFLRCLRNEPQRREVHEEENEERKEEILRMSKLIKILAINH